MTVASDGALVPNTAAVSDLTVHVKVQGIQTACMSFGHVEGKVPVNIGWKSGQFRHSRHLSLQFMVNDGSSSDIRKSANVIRIQWLDLRSHVRGPRNIIGYVHARATDNMWSMRAYLWTCTKPTKKNGRNYSHVSCSVLWSKISPVRSTGATYCTLCRGRHTCI